MTDKVKHRGFYWRAIEGSEMRNLYIIAVQEDMMMSGGSM